MNPYEFDRVMRVVKLASEAELILNSRGGRLVLTDPMREDPEENPGTPLCVYGATGDDALREVETFLYGYAEGLHRAMSTMVGTPVKPETKKEAP